MDAEKFLERSTSMSNDIKSILDRLATLEGKITPVSVKKGLNPEQKSVHQLAALFKPNNISPVLGKGTDPEHPMKGKFVGDSAEPRQRSLAETMQEIDEDMLGKVKKDFVDYLERLEDRNKIDKDLVTKAKKELGIVNKAEEDLDEFAPVGGDDREPDEEEILRQLAAQWWNGTEQQMAKAQKTLTMMGWEIGQDESGDDDAGVFLVRAGDVNGNSYMAFNHSDLDLNEEIDTDPDAIQGPSDPGDTELAHDIDQTVASQAVAAEQPVKTVAMEDGAVLEIYGNEGQGFEIRHSGRSMPTRFSNIDHADMAVKLFQQRRRRRDLSQDYIDEA
jgi:hypothetical protein